jgi:hypothetical protein
VSPSHLPLAIALAALVVPLAVIAVLAVTGDVVPIRDDALMELRVRAIGQRAELLGLYSRDGWSHPGPAIFYSLVLPYRLVGSSAGMLVGALLINGAAMVGTVLIGRVLAGTRAALTLALAMAVVARSLGPLVIRDPWVCFVTTMPFALFLVALWALVERRRWALPFTVFLASWLTQTHVGFAAVTLPLLALGAAVLVVRDWRDPDSRARRRLGGAAAVAGGVLVVMWSPVVWDQIAGRANLETMVRWFADPQEPVATLGDGLRIVLGAFGLDVLTGTRRAAPFTGETELRREWVVPVLLVLVAGGTAVAWRRREWGTLRLAAVLGATVVVSVVAVARTVGRMYEYRLLWTWVVAAVATAMALWALWNAAATRWPSADRAVTVLVVAGVVAVAVAQVTAAVDRRDERDSWRALPVQEVADQLERRYGDGTGAIVLSAGSFVSEYYLQGLLLELDKRGIDARVASDGAGLYTGYTLDRGEPVQARLRVVANDDVARLAEIPRADVVAYAGPGSVDSDPAAVRRLQREAEALIRRLADAGVPPAERTRRLLELPAIPEAVGVVDVTG